MKKNEASFQTRFGHWLEENWTESCPLELKHTKAGTYNVKQWVQKQSHQPRALLKAKQSCLYWKISDMSRECKPVDCIFFYRSPAYLVIWWDKYNEFTIIAIENLLPYFDKSIKYEDAVRISKHHGAL